MKLVSLAAITVLATASSAQSVHVVDNANGPGTDFVNLAAAISAAADGDLLLIRDGTYNASQTIDGKGLTLQAESGAVVNLSNTVIKNIGAAQFVAIRGIDWRTSTGPVLELSDNQGPIWIESGENVIPAYGLDINCALSIKNCDSVVLRDLALDPKLLLIAAGVPPIGPCTLIEDSKVALYGCDLTGGAASPVGATALTVSDSQVTLHGCSVTGGFGIGIYPVTSGLGGIGMIVTGTQGTTTVDRIKSTIQGGEGGGALGGGTGEDIVFAGTGGVVTRLAQGEHIFSAPSPLRSGDNLTLTFIGHPNERIFVMASTSPAPISSVAGVLAPLVLSPSSQLISFGILGSGSIGGRNTLNLGFVAPIVLTGVEFESFYLQGLFLGTASNPHIFLGTPTQVHVLNAAF